MVTDTAEAKGPASPTQTLEPEGAVVEPTGLATEPEVESPEPPPEGEDEVEPLELPDGWQEHEAAVAWREEAAKTAAAKIQAAKDDEILQLRAEHAKAQRTAVDAALAQAFVLKGSEMADAFLRKLKAEYAEEEAWEKLNEFLGEHADWARLWGDQLDERREKEQQARGVFRATEIMRDSLPKPLQESLAAFNRRLNLRVEIGEITQENALKDMVGKLLELVREEQKAEDAKLRSDREEQEGRQREREGTKPVPILAGRAGVAKGQPKNETEARNWHATGRWTSRQMREWLNSHR